jgi:hypothetical protein
MLAMAVLCGTRTLYTRLLIHIIDNDLVDDFEEGGESSGSCFYGVVDLVQSTHVIGLVLEDSDQFKGLMAMTSTLGS